MCGIVAIHAYRSAAPVVDRAELRTIRDHMRARGPDGEGEWYAADGRVGLGHRRLSIIDLSDRGAQPKATPDGRLVISFNGEIYNYRALREQLAAEGVRFASDSDTEVLLHLYRKKGAGMVKDLRGMFAFALWDGDRRALLLARDPYGIKPLYYADDGRTLRAASQVKALLAGGGIAREPEPAGVAGFYLFGHVPDPFTTWRDIRAVPAGSTLWVDEQGPGEPESWFSIADVLRGAEAGDDPAGDVGAAVREALLDSVRHHLVADVPVGAFLSAGIDSGALVGLMSELAEDASPVTAVTLGFEEFRGSADDEAPLAASVARRYGARHVLRRVTESEFRADFPAIVDAMDQPSIDGINTWFVSKAAREQGLKVAVSGLGGDELFGGYPSFTDIPRWNRWLAVPGRIPGLGDALRHGVTALQTVSRGFGARGGGHRSAGRASSPKLAGLVKYGGTPAGAYLLRRGLFMPWELPAIMGWEMAEAGLARLRPLDHIAAAMQPEPATDFGRIAALEASLYMRNQLLRDADWAGMAHSLEIRVPLVDAVLLQRLAPLLTRGRVTRPKEHLAGAPARSLPAAVVDRPKTGFVVPTAHWVRTSPELDTWRKVPALKRRDCHWARRLAYGIRELAA